MKQSEFRTLIHKHLTNQLSPKDYILFHQWLKADEQHLKAFREIETIWNLTGTRAEDVSKEKDFLQARVMTEINRHRDRTPELNEPKPLYSVTRIAATIMVAIACLLLMGWQIKKPVKLFATQKQKIQLIDSASVTLNVGSSIAFERKLSTVSGRLLGQAYIEAASRAVIIQTVHGNLSAFNARFFISTDSLRTFVTVESGVVIIESGNNGWRFQAGQAIRLTSKGVEPLTGQIRIHTAWYTGYIEFSHRPLCEVLTYLENHFNEKILCADEIRDRTITGMIMSDSLPEILQEFQQVAHVALTHENNLWRINARP